MLVRPEVMTDALHGPAWAGATDGKPATAVSGAQCVRGGAVVGARRGRSPSGGESYLRGGLVTGQLLVTASRIVTSVRIRLGPGPRVDPL